MQSEAAKGIHFFNIEGRFMLSIILRHSFAFCGQYPVFIVIYIAFNRNLHDLTIIYIPGFDSGFLT